MHRVKLDRKFAPKSGAFFEFRLYVVGSGINCEQAKANLVEICDKYLPNRHRIEIIDIYRNPDRAIADGVLLTPTVIKVAPLPVRHILGSLADLPPVLDALGLSDRSK
jgi:circadian clock protein KaiB